MNSVQVNSGFGMLYDPAQPESDRRSGLSINKYTEFCDIAAELACRKNTYASDVLKFMVAMDQFPNKLGQSIAAADFKLAQHLYDEEAAEYEAGFEKFKLSQTFENMVEMVDGAADLIYVICWAMMKMGIPFDACFAEVQRSNMAKLHPDGTRTKDPETGKVQKPADWTPPNLHKILTEHFDPATYKGNMRIHGDKDAT